MARLRGGRVGCGLREKKKEEEEENEEEEMRKKRREGETKER